MACFLVSAAEAAVVTVVEKHVEKKEKAREAAGEQVSTSAIPLSTKLKWLCTMLWGGAFLLMFEHIWHGEVVPWFPFLTAMENSEDMMEMFKEMATVGVCMMLLVTVVWAVMCVVAEHIAKAPAKAEAKASKED
ncbi:MAG: hypothetical protein IKO61_10030 [Lachnospiraceae bacterium]|nr:hypothetical protein [Lachnospiraceae bacterium]